MRTIIHILTLLLIKNIPSQKHLQNRYMMRKKHLLQKYELPTFLVTYNERHNPIKTEIYLLKIFLF